MISVEEAYRLVTTGLPRPQVEQVRISEAFGRILAEDLVATCNVPRFHRSAMDGYAVRAVDVREAPVELEIAGEIRAGGGIPLVLRPGQAIAIMTGASVPEGADAVQAVEHTSRADDGSRVTILESVDPGANISPRGSEAAAGETVVEVGRVIGPAEIAVLATFGYFQVKVWRRPRVALLATGDELVEVEQAPRPEQVRNSNAHALGAQLRQMGLQAEYLGIAQDEKKDLRVKISQGLERDVLILTGGVSMGEYDFVKEVFSELGLELVFTRVAMKPGKPTVFALKGEKLVFGLPGNPISNFIAFENFVRPALGRLLGMAKPELPKIKGELHREMKQQPGRTSFLPAWVSWRNRWIIEPLPWKGSADIVGFSRSNAAVIFPADLEVMHQGDIADAMLLADFFLRRR